MLKKLIASTILCLSLTTAIQADIVEVIDYTGKTFYVNLDHVVEIHHQQNGASGMLVVINFGTDTGIESVWITEEELNDLIKSRIIRK
jgi:hypothetical protein